MRLFDPRLVANLRHRIREEVRSRPEWSREQRALDPGRKKIVRAASRAWIAAQRACMPVLLCLPWHLPEAHAALLLLAAWSSLLILWRAAQIQSFLFGEGTSVFFQFPVRDEFVFRFSRRDVFRGSLWLLADSAAVFGVLALRAGSLEATFAVPFLAVLTWAVTLATAVLLASWMWFRESAIQVAMLALCIVVPVIAYLGSPEITRALYRFAQFVVPAGWVTGLAEWSLIAPRPELLYAFVPIAFCLAAGWRGYCGLQKRFAFWPSTIEPIGAADAAQVELQPIRTDEVEGQIRSRAFLPALAWRSHGLLERLASRVLNDREMRVAELLLLAPSDWLLRAFYGAATIAIAAGFSVNIAPKWGHPIMLTIPVGAALSLFTPIFGGTWPGTIPGRFGGRAISMLAVLPAGLREARSVFLKYNYVRLLFSFPAWLVAGLVIAHPWSQPLGHGAGIAAKCWLVVAALQPIYFLFKVSQATNDTKSGCLFVLSFWFGVCVVASLAVATGTLGFIGESEWVWLGTLIATALASLTAEALYRRAYHAQRFDLLAISTEPT